MSVSGPPLTDADLPALVGALGIDGFVDIHVHFMPDNVLRKVWAHFDALAESGRHGLAWPITYRTDERQRLATLATLGVVRFTSLLYPHKPDMAQWLNDWAADFAARVPGCARSATFFPEPAAAHYVRAALEAGTRVFKTHVQVGAFDPADPLLDPVWGVIADAGVPVVCHCGSGPFPGEFTGPGPISAVLSRHPQLTLVVAHAGLPEYEQFLDLVERYPRVHLDTTMAFTDFVCGRWPYPADLLPRLAAAGDRVVLGSDFPNIPYPYAHQIQALIDLDLGEPWLRAVLSENGLRLLGGA